MSAFGNGEVGRVTEVSGARTRLPILAQADTQRSSRKSTLGEYLIGCCGRNHRRSTLCSQRSGVWLDEWREILVTHGNVASVHVDHKVVRVRRVRIHIGDAKPSSALHLSVCRGLVLDGSL